MTGVILILIGSLGVAFSILILRSDPTRHDNRAFATLGLLDATMALFRGTTALHGADIADRTVMYPCALMAPFLAWATLEFAWSFPFNRPLPWRWRVPIAVATLATLVLLASGRSIERSNLANALFFVPATILMIVWQMRNLRRVEGDRLGARLVVAALIVRWITANIVYGLYRRIDGELWSQLLWIETTLVVLFGFVLIGLGCVRSNLFTFRSALGGIALEAAFFLAGLGLTAVAMVGALELRERFPGLGLALLLLAALIPLAVFAITERLRPRLEAGVDPRKARSHELLDHAMATATGDVGELTATVERTLAAISDGGVVRFRPAAAAGDDEAEPTAPATSRTAARRDGATLTVPVRTGATVHGALELRGGILDRETTLASERLADRLAAACELRRLAGELEAASRLAALGAFAAAIAHDIRTPLTSVQMNVQMLRRKVALPADDMEHFDIALEELRRLDAHVRELLDYAKPLALHRETVDARDVAEGAARTVAPLLAGRGQRLTCRHDPDVPPIAADPHRLRQVLCNLLDNAAHASPADAAIELVTRRDGDRVAIDVVDHGAGVAAADLTRIFEPFFTTRPDGTGLGLAICQKVVRGHGGDLVVRSRPGDGATFTVLLPTAALSTAA